MARDLVDFILKKLVDHPDEIQINSDRSEDGLSLTVDIDESDRGRVIGKGGRTARALRSVVRAAGALNDEQYQLEIADPADTD